MTGQLPLGVQVYAAAGRVVVHGGALVTFSIPPNDVDILVAHLRQAQEHARLQVRSSAPPPKAETRAVSAEPASTRRGLPEFGLPFPSTSWEDSQ